MFVMTIKSSAVDLGLQSLRSTFELAEYRYKSGKHASSRVWPTGFHPLDEHLSGGFRSSDLVLVGGPQGLGKTAWVIQVARNVAREGRPVLMFSYEHDQESLLTRFVSLEVGLLELEDEENHIQPDLRAVRAAFEAPDGGNLKERFSTLRGGVEALQSVLGYSDLVTLHRSNGRTTDLEAILTGIEDVHQRTGRGPLVIVDYLQKVHIPNAPTEETERTTLIVEGLKDIALQYDVPIIAVVAADKDGLTPGKRMRVSNLRGSTALAYEADTVLLLNNKYDMVARHHLVYDTTNAERFRQWVICSIEKSRSGVTGIDLEFRKHLEQSRFETTGQQVREQLIEERMFAE